MTTLAWHDLQSCLVRAPHEVLFAMKKFGHELMVAGGFVRSCVSGEYIEAHNEAEWHVPVEVKLSGEITKLLREVDPEIDPRHIAHLPAQPK